MPSRIPRLVSESFSPTWRGPGRITHMWMTVASLPSIADRSPSFLRSQLLEVFYDDSAEPSVSVPAPDFFGVVHGVPRRTRHR